ncbi:PREDICTED: importin subunit alpha-like [Fragaria vesca subsp. vesca]
MGLDRSEEKRTQESETLCLGSHVFSKSKKVTIEAGLIHARVSLLHTSDLEMKKVAIKTIIAVSKMCNNDQLRSLANDCRKPLLKLLGCKDPDIVAMCLEMLQFFDGEFGFIGRDYGVAQQLIDLLAHKNPSICKSARSLLTSLGYTIRDDSDDELLDP